MLTLQVHEKEVEIVTPECFVRGTVGVSCQINLDDFWANYANTIVFKRWGGKPYNIIINKLANTIEIPHEVMSEQGSFKIGIFGVQSDIVLPTLWSEDIKVAYGTDTHGTEPPEYTPSEIDQLRLSKQDKLTAGDNITIDENNVISATVPDPVSVDDELSDTSENPVQNKVITQALGEKQDYFADVIPTKDDVDVDLKDVDGNTVGQIVVQKDGVTITGVKYPTNANDVANKAYVDPAFEQYESILYDTQLIHQEIDDDIKPALNETANRIVNLSAEIGETNQSLENLTNSTTTALSDRYTKSETYNREEIDQKVAGAFKFKGEVASKADLPTDASDGDVYQVGDKEYAYNGTSWVELGFNVDLTAYIKTVDAESKIATAKQEAINTSKTYTDGLVGNINTILATLVDVTSSQSANSNKDLTIKEVLNNA